MKNCHSVSTYDIVIQNKNKNKTELNLGSIQTKIKCMHRACLLCLRSTYAFYCSWTFVASSYSGQNQSTHCFWLLNQLCKQGHFWLVFTVILTNNTRQCFDQLKTVDSFWPVNILTTRKVWQCLTFKCTR